MDSGVVPGFLVATTALAPPPDGLPEGDGPPSSDEELDDVSDTMSFSKSNATTAADTWSDSGGSREGSFRRKTDAQKERARAIRSDILTSHLITPKIPSREFDGSSFKAQPEWSSRSAEFMLSPSPDVPSTTPTLPRSLDAMSTAPKEDTPSARFVARDSGSARRKSRIDQLSQLAISQ